MSAEPEALVSLTRRQWRRLVRDLARRGGGVRESGAFLLARAQPPSTRVEEWIAFDDLDPDCLNGAISIRGEAFDRLWRICRERGLRVLADVHTHPSKHIAQSDVDRANPMVAQPGHVALILPHFAQSKSRPADAGVHRYAGDGRWEARFGGDAHSAVRLRWW